MKYLDLKLIEKKLQEDTDKYTVIVVYMGGKKYQITDILKKHMDAPTFADAIKKMAERRFPDLEFQTFYVVGEDGKKIDGYDFEVLKSKDLDPDGVPDKKTDADSDKPGEIDPKVDPEVEPDEIEPDEPDEIEPDEPDEIEPDEPDEVEPDEPEEVEPEDDTVDTTTPPEDDRDGDDLGTEPTEPAPPNNPPENAEAPVPVPNEEVPGTFTLVSPEDFKKMFPDQDDYEKLPKVKVPDGTSGGGSDEGGGGSSMSSAELQGITQALYDALKGGWFGLFTDEETIFTELAKIKSPEHFKVVSDGYKEMTGETLGSRLALHFGEEGKLAGEEAERLNDILKPLGGELVPTTPAGMAGTLEYKGTGSDSSSDSQTTNSDNETNEDNGVLKGETGIGWNTQENTWIYAIPFKINGETFIVAPNKQKGFLGTGLGAKYYFGKLNNGTFKADTAVTDDSFIKELDDYIKEYPLLTKPRPAAKEGDVINEFTQAQLRIVGRDQGMKGEQLTAEDAEAINQGPKD